jgi:hypothetical protein
MRSTLQVNLGITADALSVSVNKALTVDHTGTDLVSQTQVLSTSEEAITFGDLAQIKTLVLVNHDDTASITVGLANPIVAPVAVIPPGGTAVLPGISLTLYAKASAGTPHLGVYAVEN